MFTYSALSKRASKTLRYRVDKFLPNRAIELLVGDSGLGKTALAMMQGLCVAGDVPFLGLAVTPGCVLYCDAESGVDQFQQMLRALSSFLELPAPPENFYVWSPNFDPRIRLESTEVADVLCEQVRKLKPDLVIVDPLRAFWPEAEEKSRGAVAMIRQLRDLSREVGCSWLLNHHRRKRNQHHSVTLEGDKHRWFEEAAGSHALVNGCDTRLGLEMTEDPWADLTLAGFIRAVGWTGSLSLQRVYDDDGDPLGYRLMTGIDQLGDSYRSAFEALGPRFRFKDVQAALGGKSASNANEMLNKCLTLGLVRRDGKEYVKTGDGVERGGQS